MSGGLQIPGIYQTTRSQITEYLDRLYNYHGKVKLCLCLTT
jgi:hypothetical protein